MTLLLPLGFLALVSVVALLIIYLIKPNYQQKTVSSTFIWKLSLKYRKKRIPISRLRNILIIICQIVALTAGAIILTQPNLILKAQADHVERIAIIDSSASMRTQIGGETRFERAIDGVLESFDSLPADGELSVIIADDAPYFLKESIKRSEREKLEQSLDTLLVRDNFGTVKDVQCAYGAGNISGAMALCESVLKRNPDAEIILFTDVEYKYKSDAVTVVNVCGDGEWNAGIINAYAQIEENYYVFYVEVACYGVNERLTLTLEVQDANTPDSSATGDTFTFQEIVVCNQDVAKTVIFKYFPPNAEVDVDADENKQYHFIDDEFKVTSYQSVYVSIDAKDSFDGDNKFNIYGGQKEVLKIQYSSTLPNIFFNGILDVILDTYKNNWDIQIDKVGAYDAPAEQGYDFYIYEHLSMPAVLPVDGVVFFVNPGTVPSGAGFQILDLTDFRGISISLTEEEKHPISNKIVADDITVSRIISIKPTDPDYKVLMSCDGDPVLLVKDTDEAKVVIMPFSLHYSSLPLSEYFPFLLLNMFDYFLPPTVEGNAFEVSQSIALKSRGQSVTVEYGGEVIQTNSYFPAGLNAELPGTYTLKQSTIFGKNVSERIYVRIPANESNVWSIEDSLPEPFTELNQEEYFRDLWIFIAALLVAVLFIEWMLHLREEQ